MSGYRFVWYWLGVLVAALGIMRLVWNEFPDLQIEDALFIVLVLTDSIVEIVRYFFEEPIQQALIWVEQQVGISLWLQYHWVYAFALLQLFLLNYAAAAGGGALRRAASVVFALIFGSLTGTVHLGHPSVLFYPVSGVFLFAAFTLALAGRFAEGGRTALFYGGGTLALAVLGALFYETLSVAAGLTKSFGFMALVAASVVGSVLIAWRGLLGAQEGSSADAGRRMGFNILKVLLIAGTILTLSVLGNLVFPNSPTTPVASGSGFRDCAEAYCPVMKPIPTGTFEMGSDDAEVAFAKSLGAPDEWTRRERPKHKVAIRAFAMSITEVTREQFEAFVAACRYKPSGFCFGIDDERKVEFGGRRRWDNPGFPQEGDHPAVCITWHDAKAYAAFLTHKTGRRYRLPSEAEWEYAARAGTTTSRYWGESNEDACQYANVADASVAAFFKFDPKDGSKVFPCNDGFAFTAPVSTYKPNAFGLHDMLGNAWEWTYDCYNETYMGAPTNGLPWVSGNCNGRVVRGGGWYGNPWRVRSANRSRSNAPLRYYDVGVRVARTD